MFTRAWTNIHTADSCVCVFYINIISAYIVCKHGHCLFAHAFHKRAAILDKAHHTHENLPSELRREGDKKDVDTGSDDGRAQECSCGQP